jgi:hypothetical protein
LGALLFDERVREAAERHGSESHFRWLALSDDPEAVALRAALETCYGLAGEGGGPLRKGLMHERWGQHAGALAHLLTLGLLVSQGWQVENEPDLGGQSPDVLARRDAATRLLVEVRAITGAGDFPWEERRLAGQSLGRDDPQRDRLYDAVAKVLTRKAEVYRPLVGRLAIPYLICLYEDKDCEISAIVRELAFGRTGAPGDIDARDPDGGLFAEPSARLEHVSAVIVFGRLDTEDGALLLAGDLIENPHAELPVAGSVVFPGLRAYRRFDRERATPFTLEDRGTDRAT